MTNTARPAQAERITSAERNSILVLIRAREKVARADVDARMAELLADFEKQLDTRYKYDSDEVWKAANAAAEAAVAEANIKIAARCREMGIHEHFAPGISVGWYSRGRSGVKEERAEMRRVAHSRIEALGKAAKAEIAKRSVTIQTELVASALTTDAAQAFLDRLPTAEALMPRLDVKMLAAELPRRDEGY